MTNAEIVFSISLMAIGLITTMSLLTFKECIDKEKDINKSNEIIKLGIRIIFYIAVISACIVGFVCN